jgi:hypothetical protein
MRVERANKRQARGDQGMLTASRMNPEVEAVTSELHKVGIKPEIEVTAGGHVRISWRATPDKELRTLFTSKTGSDYRGRLNIRANVRALLKQDNVHAPEKTPKPKAAIEKILELPKPTVSFPDQVAAMRAEISDLTDLVLDLACLVKASLGQTIVPLAPEAPPASLAAPEPAAPLPATPRIAPEPARPLPASLAQQRLALDGDKPARGKAGGKRVIVANRKMRVLDHVGAQWVRIEAIMVKMGLDYKQVYNKLYQQKIAGRIELSHAQARLLPGARVAPLRKVNGHARSIAAR